MKSIKLSIIVLSYNTKKLLKNCLESLIKNSPPKTEIIVIDNYSIDGSREFLEKIKKKKFKNVFLRVVLNSENLGFAGGNNQGIKLAKGKYIMILNSDTIIRSEAFEKMVGFLKEHEGEKVAISPLLLLSSGTPQIDYYMKFPNLWQIFLYHNPILRPLVMRIFFLRKLIAQEPENKPFELDQLPGAALMTSKKIWQKVGFLDENYHFLFEDVDWCWRAKKEKVKLMVIPRAKIIHFGGASWRQKLKQNSSDFYYQFFSSFLLFAEKNYGEFKRNIFKWAIIFNFLITFKFFLAWEFYKNNGRQKKFL